MNVEIMTKPAFAVIGIEGRGPADSGPQWIAPLWDAARRRFPEIQALATGDSWGLMSAVDDPFARWKEEGLYLAGWEVPLDAPAPQGWTRWQLPETTFAAIPTTMQSYTDAWHYFHHHFLPHAEYAIGGAAHEYYPASFQDPATDTLYLYFTLKRT